MSRGSKLLSAKHTLLAKEKAGIPMVGNSQLLDTTKYIAFNAQGQGGTISVVDANTKRLVGVTNFDGNKLNAGRDVVIDGVRLLKGTLDAANVAAEQWADSVDSGAATVLVEAALQNAEIIISQGGNTLVDMPVRDIMALGSNHKFRELASTPLIRSNQEFELEIKYPQGVSVSSAEVSNYRLEFRVIEAKLK